MLNLFQYISLQKGLKMSFLLQLIVICASMSTVGFCMGLMISWFYRTREVDFYPIRYVLSAVFLSTVAADTIFYFKLPILVLFQGSVVFLSAWIFCCFFIAIGEGRKWIHPTDFVRLTAQGKGR